MGTERYWRAKSWRQNVNFTPEEFWLACCEYFDWGLENPLFTAQVGSFQGDHEIVKVPRNRVFSKAGLMTHLGMTPNQWSWLAEKDEFKEIISYCEQIIYVQKFEGAASGLFNATVIARDLGLVDKREETGKVTVVINKDDADL